MTETHEARIGRMMAAFTIAMQRFLTRLENSEPAAAERAPDYGGWSAAQIGWHVAKVNAVFAGLLTGTVAGAEPAPQDFVEPEWEPIAQRLSGELVAPEPFRPPDAVKLDDAIARLKRSGDRLRDALAALPASRGSGFILRSQFGGVVSLYQVGEWATAHVIKHNIQLKRVLGR